MVLVGAALLSPPAVLVVASPRAGSPTSTATVRPVVACAECAYNLAKEMYDLGLWNAREAIDFVLNWED